MYWSQTENTTQPNLKYWTYESKGITYYVDEREISKWGAWFQANQSEIFIIVLGVLSSCIMGGIWLHRYIQLYKEHKSSLIVHPVVGKPNIPFDTNELIEYKGYDWRKFNRTEPRIYVGTYRKWASLHRMHSVVKVSNIVRDVLKIERPIYERVGESIESDALWHRYLKPIPEHSKVVALAMPGFDYGRECYHFQPIKGAKLDSHCTYQMYGENRCVVTRYHVNNKVYVAGFCLFIMNPYEHGAVYPGRAIHNLCKHSVFQGDSVEFKISMEFETRVYNNEKAARKRLRLEKQQKKNRESDEEPAKIRVTVVNEEMETPILESKSIGSSLDLDPPNLDYTESPEDEIDKNPSMTPESLRGNIVPLASSEESSLLGSEVDKVSLNKRIQKDGYTSVDLEDVDEAKDDDDEEAEDMEI